MLSASCHCGHVAFEIDGDLPEALTRCTCSFCSKRGSLWAYYPPERFRLTTPADHDATYRWQSKLVAHNFCPVCGCGTYSISPDFQPDGRFEEGRVRIAVNARLFDGFEAADWPVTVIDGRNLW